MTDLVERVRDFVVSQVIPTESVLSGGGAPGHDAMAALRRLAMERGLWALPLSVPLGGQGLTLGEYAPIAESEGISDYGPAALGSDLLLDAVMLERHGTDEVRSRYLMPMAAGNGHPSFALTEPHRAGSDPNQMVTAAVLDSDHWVINGVKWFTSRAAWAAFVTVACRTAEGISLIVVPTNAPGFRIVRSLPVIGGSDDQYEVAFEQVRVPSQYLLGKPGRGLAIAAERLTLGRTLRCLRWLGQSQRAFDLMCTRMVSRSVHGGTLADKPLLHNFVFDSQAEIASARALTYAAVDAIASGRDTRNAVATAKVVTARAFDRVVDRAIQIYGAEGLTDDTALPMLHRTARAARILDGPDELHVASVATSILARHKAAAA